jgi:dTDP-4-amino-4,6-dideoxygalactose transaminase
MHSVLTQLVDEDIGPGKATRELVAALSAYLGAAGGAAVTSLYAAVALAAELVGLKPGARVVVPALAPAVYRDSLSSRGLEVVLVDVDPQTGTPSREGLAAALSGGAAAVFAHHTLGFPMAYEAATEAGIPIIEDVTSSLPPAAPAEDGLVPSLPDLLLVSLDAEGLITAGAGATLLTRRRSQLAALKGAACNAAQHQQLPNMNAALALAQIQDLDHDRARRQEIALMYREALRRSRHGTFAASGDGGTPVSSFPVLLQDSLADVRQYARKHGVETRPAYAESCLAAAPEQHESFPNARRLLLCCLLFPLYPMLSRKSAESVCKVLATLP